MPTIEKFAKYLTNSDYRFLVNNSRGFYKHMSDETFLKRLYKAKLHEELDLDNPQSFNEKIQWLKIHDRNPFYTTLVDKIAVKKWVADQIGPEYVLCTYGIWSNAKEISFDGLPEQFVLKTNHDSGSIVICRNKAELDTRTAIEKINTSLKKNFYWKSREWPYKDVKPRVFAEEYLEDIEFGELIDYKLMCFEGKVRCLFTCTGRANHDLRVDFFDTEWNHLPFTRHYPNAETPPKAPINLDGLIRAAEKLAAGLPFARVDFYEVAHRNYFGEITLYPGAGLEEFEPPEWDKRLGSWIKLPNQQEKR